MRDHARERTDGTRCRHCGTPLAWRGGRAACVCGEVYGGERPGAGFVAALLLVVLVLILSMGR